MEEEDASSTTLLCINKSHSTNEQIHKGVAPVPSKTVRPDELNDSKVSDLNYTKKLKTKRKNKLSVMDNQMKHNIELHSDPRKKLMNSNRVIEPFSPTFERPDDFLPSNQTSFRPLAMAKYGKNLEKHNRKDHSSELENSLTPAAIFNGTEKLRKPGSRGTEVQHNRTQSSSAETIDFEKLKHIKEADIFKETGKFINPLSETSEITTRQKSATRRFAQSKDTNRNSKRRPKTGNGRYSRRSKPKTKSEERRDTKRIFSKSVDQSNHETSSIYPQDMSIIK